MMTPEEAEKLVRAWQMSDSIKEVLRRLTGKPIRQFRLNLLILEPRVLHLRQIGVNLKRIDDEADYFRPSYYAPFPN